MVALLAPLTTVSVTAAACSAGATGVVPRLNVAQANVASSGKSQIKNAFDLSLYGHLFLSARRIMGMV
jgi:hypothetical protein